MAKQTPSTASRCLVEVCIASSTDAAAAKRGGADRLELNSALELGGLTPSMSLFHEVRRRVDLPVIVMIRPRAAGFCYRRDERRLMLREAEHFLGLGADGVATGSLTRDGDVDTDFVAEVVRLAEGRDVVFHRAFDSTASPMIALRQLTDLGVTRVLTAGGQDSARAGALQIARWQAAVGNRIELLPGGGIDSENAAEIVRVTGCRQIHGSFSRLKQNRSANWPQTAFRSTCQRRVAAVRNAVDGMLET